MQALRFQEYGGPDVLSVDSVPRPDPGPSEARVTVEAAALNPVDYGVMSGVVGTQTPPGIPGVDVAGVVDAAGAGTAIEPGTRVFGTGLSRDRSGAMAEAVVADADALAPLPDGVGFEEGAAIALVGATAWRALVTYAEIGPADRVLVHGGNGGVGHVAVQLAAAMGARVTATARPPHHDRLHAIGADDVIDYTAEDLQSRIRSAGRPDLILDHRLDDYLALDAAVLAPGGQIVAIGGDGDHATAELGAARDREPALRHVSVFRTSDFRPVLERLAALVHDGAVVPEIHEVFELGAAAEGYRHLQSESTFGKLIATPQTG
ncbi:MAG: zinc-binding dehydrogenase [Halobacteriaceae archaeon]